MTSTKSLPTLLAVAATALLLAACGGSDGPVTSSLDGLPDSATASTEALQAYLGDLVSQPSDDREPYDVADSVALPTSDTDEPAALH